MTGPRPWLALTLGLLAALAPWLPAQATGYLGFLAYREEAGKPWQAPAVIEPTENPPDGDYAFQVVVTDPGEDLGIKPTPAGGWPKWVTLRGLFNVKTLSAGQHFIKRANLDTTSTFPDAQLIGLPTDRPLWGSYDQWIRVRPWLKPLSDAVETARGKEKGSPDLNVLRALMGVASAVAFVAAPNDTENTFTLRRIHRLDPKGATYAKSIGQFWDPGNPNAPTPAEIQSDVANAIQDQRGFSAAGYLGEPNRDQLDLLGYFFQFLNRTPTKDEDLKGTEPAKDAEPAKAVSPWLMVVYVAIAVLVLGIASIGAVKAAEWVKRHRPDLAGPVAFPRLRRRDLYRPRPPARNQGAPNTMTATRPDASRARPQGTAAAGSAVDDLRREIMNELARVTDNVNQLAERLYHSNDAAAHWREQMTAEMTRWRNEVEADINAVLEKQKERIKVITKRLDDYPNQRFVITQPIFENKPREQPEVPGPVQGPSVTTDAGPVATDDAPADAERAAMAALAEGLVAVGAITPGDLPELLDEPRIANRLDLLEWVILRKLAPNRPLAEYRRYDDAIRRITQDFYALILPGEGGQISSTDHRVLGYRRVERGALGVVAEVTRPGLLCGEGPTKATILPAEVWETR